MTKPADLTCALNGRQTQAARRLPRRRLPLPLTRTRHKLPGVYRVGADRVLTKRRASSAVQENALAAMMRDLDDLAKGLPAIAARLATEAGRRAARAELARADDDATCIVCLSQKRDVVFLTCGHLVVCSFQRPFPGWGHRHRDMRGLREGVRAVSRVPRVRRGQPAARVYAVT